MVSLPLTWAWNVAALPSSATTLCSGWVNVGACVDMLVGTLQQNEDNDTQKEKNESSQDSAFIFLRESLVTERCESSELKLWK